MRQHCNARIATAPTRPAAIWQLIDTRSIGGIERHVASLASSLRDRGFDPTVMLWCDHGANPWCRQLTDAHIRMRFLNGRLSGLIAALRAESPKLLHTHGYKANILGRLAARVTQTPVVSSFHAGETPPFPVNVYTGFDRWTSFLAPRIAVSGKIQSQLPFQSFLVPNFIRIPAAPREQPLPRQVAFVGRLSYEKAPDLFCELCVDLDPRIECVIYGDGPMRTTLAERFGGRVRFAGLVTDMEPVWKRIGLLVMPSRQEGLPMAALEALANAVPVLASRVGDLPKVVVDGHTGWTFDFGDLGAARRGLHAWSELSAANGQQMRRACWQHVRTYFSEESLLPRILQVYSGMGLEAS